MNRTIYLVRHGESVANAGLPTADPARIALTAKGEAQARHLAATLNVDPARVLTSTYDRAMGTAIAFCNRYSVTPKKHPLTHEFVTLDPTLVAGTSNLERKPLVDAYWAASQPDRRSGPHAESFLEFAARVDDFAAELDDLPDVTVLFGHGMWFAMLIWRTMGFPVETHRAMKAFRAFQIGLPMPNCAVYTLSGQGTHRAVRFHAEVTQGMLSLEEQAYAIQ